MLTLLILPNQELSLRTRSSETQSWLRGKVLPTGANSQSPREHSGLLPWHLREQTAGFTPEGRCREVPGLICTPCGGGLPLARARFSVTRSPALIRPSTDSTGTVHSLLWSHNARAFGIIRRKHHTSLWHGNRRTRRLAEQTACLRASLMGKVRNLFKYLFLIPLAKILTCKNTKCIAFQCQVMSKAAGSAFYMQLFRTTVRKVVKRRSLLVLRSSQSLGYLEKKTLFKCSGFLIFFFLPLITTVCKEVSLFLSLCDVTSGTGVGREEKQCTKNTLLSRLLRTGLSSK